MYPLSLSLNNDMARATDNLAGIVAVFGTVGLGLGLTGYNTMAWAQSQFLTAAGGETAQQFGPIFVALVYFQGANVAFFLGPVVATLAGLLFGTRMRDRRTAAAVAGAGSLAGFYVMALVTILLSSLALSGPGASQSFGLLQALVPVLLAGIPTAIAGAIAGYVGPLLG